MPIIRAGEQLLYYAHVPKCGGSSIENYLIDRFGSIAFLNKRHHNIPEDRRWSRTSPQHVDLTTLNLLFPAGFFNHSFSVVRHPVRRLISTFHFQLEVEQSTPSNVSFSFWLEGLADTMASDPFVYDNHTRPMVDVVPENATIFHLEHGLDAIVPWLDGLTGTTEAPRTIGKTNERKGRLGKARKVEPSQTDLDLIAEIYAEDFERFGYVIDQPKPLAAAPELDQAYLAARDAEVEQMNTPTARASSWLLSHLAKVTR